MGTNPTKKMYTLSHKEEFDAINDPKTLLKIAKNDDDDIDSYRLAFWAKVKLYKMKSPYVYRKGDEIIVVENRADKIKKLYKKSMSNKIYIWSAIIIFFTIFSGVVIWRKKFSTTRKPTQKETT